MGQVNALRRHDGRSSRLLVLRDGGVGRRGPTGPARTARGCPRSQLHRRSGHDSPLYSAAMSGHSKWSTIKRQKGLNDAKRGAMFTKVAREVAVAARTGGGDPDANYRLRLGIEKARAPNIDRESTRPE